VRFLPLLLITIVAAGIAAAPASADSIVYAKKGDLYLSSPDGAKRYRLTRGGGYSSPSQADNGIIGALRYGKLVRLDRRGRMLNAPVAGMGSPGPASSRNIGGPYEPRISPDGKRFSYYFYVQTSFDDYENDIRWIDTGSYGTWTWADRFTSPASGSEYSKLLTQAEWVSNDRLLGTMGFWMNMWTWQLGTGHGYTSNAAQWWFGLQDPPDEWGVAAYHWYSDPALSPDGTKLAMTDGEGDQSRLYIAATHGPAWSGHAPYPEPDYVGGHSDLAAPTIKCQSGAEMVSNPSWSRDGDLLAYGTGDGVHVMTIPDGLDCARTRDAVLAPGAVDPAFGPAGVNLADAPRSGGVRVGHIALRPRTFRSGRGTRVRFTLSRRARVTIMAGGVGIRVRGHRGANAVRFRPRLPAGRYRVRVSAGGSSAGARFRIRD
jgi:hypothetical protein